MRPLKTNIVRLGGSACLGIPMTLAKMYEWAPGAIVRAKLVVGGALFEKEVRELYGGRAAGIIIPKEVMLAHGLEVGAEIEVPFYEWVTVKGVAWEREDERPPEKKRVTSKKRALKH